MTHLTAPAEVLYVTHTLEDAGFEAYLVGGCVRDLIRGETPKDWDVTTNATPEHIQALFPETFYENEYGTVGVVQEDASDPRLKVIEVTPYRLEGAYTNARHPDEVHFSDTLEADLERRDFTMNAIAFNPTEQKIVDPYDGQEDIHHGRIQAVGDADERFAEDALRMMRAIRLAAELNFTIEASTMAAITKNVALLEKISKERIRDELVRILMSKTPLQALAIAQKLDMLTYIIPELNDGVGIDQNQAHSFDVFEHLLRSVQHAADKGWDLDIRLAALLHDIGKPATRYHSKEKGDWTFHGHEVVGARMARKIMQDLRFPKETAKKVENLVRWHMFFSDPDLITLSAVRRMVSNVGEEHIWDLLNLRICDRIGTGRPKEQPFRFRKYKSMVEEALRSPVSVGKLAIKGEDLMQEIGEKPGPRIGWILHALLEEVLDDPEKNTPVYMKKRAQELAKLKNSELHTLGTKGKERRDEEDEKEVAALRKKHHVV